MPACEMGFSSNCIAPPISFSRFKDTEESSERIEEPVHHTFFQRNDRIIGDRNALRTHFRAALSDVAQADALELAQIAQAVVGIKRLHLERRRVYKEARANKLVVHVMVAQNVA